VDIPPEPNNLSINAFLMKYIEEKDLEEIIIEGKGKVTERSTQETGDFPLPTSWEPTTWGVSRSSS
jgi:hypothetical protein